MKFEWSNQIWPNTTAQCTFCTAQGTFCTVVPTLKLAKQKSWKNSAKCAMCSAKCALCNSVRSNLIAPFKFQMTLKKEAFAESFIKIGWKLKRLQANKLYSLFARFPKFCKRLPKELTMGKKSQKCKNIKLPYFFATLCKWCYHWTAVIQMCYFGF